MTFFRLARVAWEAPSSKGEAAVHAASDGLACLRGWGKSSSASLVLYITLRGVTANTGSPCASKIITFVLLDTSFGSHHHG